jgi:hypothetical protein
VIRRARQSEPAMRTQRIARLASRDILDRITG